METLPMSRDCIVCGRENPVGLKVRFVPAEGGVTAEVLPADHFQGFTGVLHGGLVAALLDDAMWWAIYATHQVFTMTAEITIRYKQPVPVDQPLQVQGQVESARGRRLFVTRGRISGADGVLYAEATGKFMAAPKELAESLARGME